MTIGQCIKTNHMCADATHKLICEGNQLIN
jgi:hypothetical protein